MIPQFRHWMKMVDLRPTSSPTVFDVCINVVRGAGLHHRNRDRNCSLDLAIYLLCVLETRWQGFALDPAGRALGRFFRFCLAKKSTKTKKDFSIFPCEKIARSAARETPGSVVCVCVLSSTLAVGRRFNQVFPFLSFPATEYRS